MCIGIQQPLGREFATHTNQALRIERMRQIKITGPTKMIHVGAEAFQVFRSCSGERHSTEQLRFRCIKTFNFGYNEMKFGGQRVRLTC